MLHVLYIFKSKTLASVKRKEWPRAKMVLLKRYETEMRGQANVSGFWWFIEFLIMMTLLQNIVNSGDQGIDVIFMGLNFLIKITRSQNI